MARYIRTVYTDTAGIRRKYETKKQWNTPDPDGINDGIILFCNLWINPASGICKKNYVTQAAELIEAGAYDIKDFQEYFTQIDGKAGDYQCYYDQDWNEIKKTKARYHMMIKLERQPAKVLGKITMWRENQQIYQLDILRYRQERKDNERS